MFNDYIYTINQAAIILNKSDKTIRLYITEGGLASEKRREQRSGIEKVYISAQSLSDFAQLKHFDLNHEALERYTKDRDILLKTFKKTEVSTERKNPRLEAEQPPHRTSNTALEDPVVQVLQDRIEQLEKDRAALERKVEEKDTLVESKNTQLLDETKESSKSYQLLAIQKENIESSFRKMAEYVRIMHQSTNRDLRRLRLGKLSPEDIAELPLPSLESLGEFHEEQQTEMDFSGKENVVEVAAQQGEPVDVGRETDDESRKQSKPTKPKNTRKATASKADSERTDSVAPAKPKWYEITWFRSKYRKNKKSK